MCSACDRQDEGSTFGEDEAREVANVWHSGQWTGLYSFASTGSMDRAQDALREARAELLIYGSAMRVDDRAAVERLVSYLEDRIADEAAPPAHQFRLIVTGRGPEVEQLIADRLGDTTAKAWGFETGATLVRVESVADMTLLLNDWMVEDVGASAPCPTGSLLWWGRAGQS